LKFTGMEKNSAFQLTHPKKGFYWPFLGEKLIA
jgi:hypothetical protein